MQTATLKHWAGTYGFLSNEDGGGDVYAHLQEFERASLKPRVGVSYTFDAVMDTRRPGRRRAASLREA
ncbi:cold-shock protein [Aurantimonas endophytica]|uniref:Cold shock CspA family protein n=1 Tax=Aurantimonas endophytica TaxID=1522175 RepID=A0A7W6MP56_9HYPH|nr:cold-shock protein [Aurantimonas endophytica]MBB4002640.1 cold shock CspA family protein [Aurantimonas endophytica]MCO6403520.1 hypothetical protein [Aurantimonas endophytica]